MYIHATRLRAGVSYVVVVVPRAAQAARKAEALFNVNKGKSLHPMEAKMMKRQLLATSVLLVAFLLAPAQSQTVNSTQVALSCSDGHSVIFTADQTELTGLLADLQALNTSRPGTTCPL